MKTTEPDPSNPFEYRTSFGNIVQTFDAHDRIEQIKGMGLSDLEKVVILPDCQKTVVQAAERRIRVLRKRGLG